MIEAVNIIDIEDPEKILGVFSVNPCPCIGEHISIPIPKGFEGKFHRYWIVEKVLHVVSAFALNNIELYCRKSFPPWENKVTKDERD